MSQGARRTAHTNFHPVEERRLGAFVLALLSGPGSPKLERDEGNWFSSRLGTAQEPGELTKPRGFAGKAPRI